MKKLTNVFLVRWTSRPTGKTECKIYRRRGYAHSFATGIAMAGVIVNVTNFGVGDAVTLTREANASTLCPKGRGNNKTARILTHLSDIPGGVFLDRDLRGTRHWNIEELELA